MDNILTSDPDALIRVRDEWTNLTGAERLLLRLPSVARSRPLTGLLLGGRVLDHPDDDREAELLARDRPERLEGVRPEGVELRGRVEVGDRRLAVPHALALRHADVERAGQAVGTRDGRGLRPGRAGS